MMATRTFTMKNGSQMMISGSTNDLNCDAITM